MSLPKCKLCGQEPAEWGSEGNLFAGCQTIYCNMWGTAMAPNQWLSLMSPPPVTDKMVERGTVAARGAGYGIGDDLARIVLEAALNPKGAPDAP